MNRTTQTIALVCLASTALPFGAALAKEEHRRVDASPDGVVIVSNTGGSVELMGWPEDVVEVVADLGWGVDELIVERDGDEVYIKVKVPKDGGRNIASDLMIHIPEDSSIEVGVVSADITVEDIAGEQTLYAVSGDIRSQLQGADVEVEAVSGDIELFGSGQALDIEASTVSGDIDVIGNSGFIEATSVSGDIAIEDGAFERVQGNTVNGSIEFRAQLVAGGKLDMETINGSIDVDFVDDVSARFYLETFNGRIRNCFGPKAERSNRYGPGRELQFTVGSGESRVTIKTLNGGVSLCRD